MVSGCRRQQSGTSESIIEVYSLPHGPSPCKVHHLATFLLPTLFESSVISYWSASSASANSLLHSYFTCSRYVLMHLRVHGSYSLFVLLSTLIRHSLAPRAGESTPLVLPWKDWGPNSTRFVPHLPNDVIISGYRAVFPSEIWDFTPAHVLGASGTASNIAHSEPTEILVDTETIVTSLPYLRIKHGLPQTESDLSIRTLIDSDGHPMVCIILSKYSGGLPHAFVIGTPTSSP